MTTMDWSPLVQSIQSLQQQRGQQLQFNQLLDNLPIGPQTDLFRKLPPNIGMPLLLQTIQSQMTPKNPIIAHEGDVGFDATGKQIFSVPKPAKYGEKGVGVNPTTGKPETYVLDEQGNAKWTGIVPGPNVEFVNGQAVDKTTGQPLATPPIPQQAAPYRPLSAQELSDKTRLESAQTVARRQAEIANPLPAPASALSLDAINNGAQYKMETGQYPGTMRDKASVAAIENRIAELKPEGMSAADWARALSSNAVAYRAKQQTAVATGKQQALTSVNEDTVNGAINILDGLLKKGAASSLPFTSANEALQWMARQSNDPDAVNLKNAVAAISNEYARVMTGQTGGAASSDSARNEAATRLLLGFKEGTMRSAAGQMQREMKNRSDAYLHAMNQLTNGQYGGVTASPYTPIDQPQQAQGAAPSSNGWSVKRVSP